MGGLHAPKQKRRGRRAVEGWLGATQATWLPLILLYRCCPELSPDETPQQDVKTNARDKSLPTNTAEMIVSVGSHLSRLQKHLQELRAVSKEEHFRHAARP